MRPEILVVAPIYAPVLAQLEREYIVHKFWDAPDPDRFIGECGNVRAVVTTGVRTIEDRHVERLPKLALIACFGNPHGTVDLARMRGRGVEVTGTPDDIAGTVAELAAGMAVALMRRIIENDRFVRAGRWPTSAPAAGTSLQGKTCGIVGLGRIGRETAKRLAAFGMTVCWHGPREKSGISYRYFSDVVTLARAADCLVLTCPERPETRNLIDARVLEALGPDGYLVNVARGAVLDEQALIGALSEKRIAGAALDVYWDEPRVPQALTAMDNVVLLPHIGSSTREVREERGRKLMANLRAHFAGEPVPYRVPDIEETGDRPLLKK